MPYTARAATARAATAITPLSFIDALGYYGPYLAFLISIFLLYKTKTYLFIYLVGFATNMIINYVLKGIIKEARPATKSPISNPLLSNSPHSGIHIYGMPSGHAEGIFYSTAYIIGALHNFKISAFFLLLSFNTIIQRVRYKNHTIAQVIVGSIVGIIVGYGFYTYAKKTLEGSLREKRADNAPNAQQLALIQSDKQPIVLFMD